MYNHIKKAWTSIGTKRIVMIALAVLILVYLSLVVFNVAASDSQVMSLVSAQRPDGGDSYVLTKDALFENKILDFLKADKLCAVTKEQSDLLRQSYTFEVKEYYIAQQAKTVFVLYVDGPKASLAQLEKIAGPIDDGKCSIVHGSKMIAVMAPVTI